MTDYPLNICMLSVHTCPLATLGGKETGGMNVYVRDLSLELARQGHQVDIYTRSQDACVPRISHGLGARAKVIHIVAGPEAGQQREHVRGDAGIRGARAGARRTHPNPL